VEISFETRKLAKVFNTKKELDREYGTELSKTITKRLSLMEAANCLNEVPITPPFRRHELKHNRKGQFAVDLVHPHRLVFKPNHNPLPVRADGGLDLRRITAITILGVEDYH